MVFATLFIENWEMLIKLKNDGHLSDFDLVDYVNGLTQFYADETEPTFTNPILTATWISHKPFAEKTIKNYKKKVEGGKHSGGLKRDNGKDAQACLSMLKDAQASQAISNNHESLSNKHEVVNTDGISLSLTQFLKDKDLLVYGSLLKELLDKYSDNIDKLSYSVLSKEYDYWINNLGGGTSSQFIYYLCSNKDNILAHIPVTSSTNKTRKKFV